MAPDCGLVSCGVVVKMVVVVVGVRTVMGGMDDTNVDVRKEGAAEEEEDAVVAADGGVRMVESVGDTDIDGCTSCDVVGLEDEDAATDIVGANVNVDVGTSPPFSPVSSFTVVVTGASFGVVNEFSTFAVLDNVG